MMRRLWTIFPFCFLGIFSVLQAQHNTLKSPDEFLPVPLGTRFTPHHILVDYFRYVDSQSDRVQFVQYGETYEYRPLLAAIISSRENMQRLEQIRLNNLHRTGLIPGTVIEDSITIVYLSFSIHVSKVCGYSA